ncbi:hypothetical protein WMF38_54385 [Sorangium sp. So ce118]
MLNDIVLELPIELRSLLTQHDLEGVPTSEVAALWSLPISTAYRRRSLAVVRAQAALVKHLAAERNGRSREGGDEARRPGIRPAPG